MAGPDWDELFGETPVTTEATATSISGANGPRKPHPALLHAVSMLLEAELSEDKIHLYEDDLEELDGENPVVEMTVARLLIEAQAAFACGDWEACHVSAKAAQSSSLQLLRENWMGAASAQSEDSLQYSIWDCPAHRHCHLPESDYPPLVLAELLLAICSAAKADEIAAVQHADVAFSFTGQGVARNSALLFSKCFAEEVAACRLPCADPLASTSFITQKSRCVSRPSLAMSVTSVYRWSLDSNQSSSWFSAFVTPATDMPDEEQLRTLLASGKPFVVKEPIERWPASSRWSSLAYLDSVAGHRMVPVKSAPHDDVVFKTLRDFLANHLVPSCNHCNSRRGAAEGSQCVAGLAPHELLEQCPPLRGDIPGLSPVWREALGRTRRTSVWLGTHDVATAACCSDREQCVAQVFGVQYVILFPPKAGGAFYADGDYERDMRLHGLTSKVNLEDKTLLKQHPALARVPAQVAELQPGDLLFIPRGWWYQLRSLSPACSVFFRF